MNAHSSVAQRPLWQYHLLLGFGAALLFFPYLGAVHLFDWDEVNFAECAREMLLLGDYTRVYIDFEPFWEKPPLFFWLQILSMKLFGINEYAARFPNALCGLLTVLLLFELGRRAFSLRMGLWWAALFGLSLTPHFYFRSGIIDPWFNLFIFLSVHFFVLYVWRRVRMPGVQLSWPPLAYLALSGAWLGLAMLTKGQAALLIVGLLLTAYWVTMRWRSLRQGGLELGLLVVFATCGLVLFRLFMGYFRGELAAGLSTLQFISLLFSASFALWWLVRNIPYLLPLGHLGLWLGASVAVTATWFGWELAINGPWFLQTFTTYQIRLLTTEDAGHGGFPGYHFVVVLLGCFPASVFALRVLARVDEPRTHWADYLRWMRLLLWVVLVLFSLVQSKIVHYSSMTYFPLLFLAAYGIEATLAGQLGWRRWQTVTLGVIGGLLALALIAMPIVGLEARRLAEVVADPFARANLQAEVVWGVVDFFPGLLLLLGLLWAMWLFLKAQQAAAPPAYRSQAFAMGLLGLGVGLALCLSTALPLLVPKVERYSQGAAIDFFKTLQGQDVLLKPYKYKSYAHLFYSAKQPNTPPVGALEPQMLAGQTDRPAYLIARLPKAAELDTLPTLQRVYDRNGFVVFYAPGRVSGGISGGVATPSNPLD